MQKTVTLTHTRYVTFPRGVWVDARIKQNPDKPWNPDAIEYEIVIRSEGPTEEAATEAFGDANAAIREAFGG